MDLDDLLGFLVGGQLSTNGTGQLRSQENSALLRSSVEASSQTITLLSVKGSEVASNVFANTFDLGEFAG